MTIIQGVFLFTDYKTLLIPLSLDQATVSSPGAPNFDSGLFLYSLCPLYDWRLNKSQLFFIKSNFFSCHEFINV